MPERHAWISHRWGSYTTDFRHTGDRSSAPCCIARGMIAVALSRRWMPGERGQFCVVDTQHGCQVVKGGTAGTMATGFILIDRCRPNANRRGEEGDGQAGNSLASVAQPLTKAEIGRWSGHGERYNLQGRSSDAIRKGLPSYVLYPT
jgi:hypothetical protein